MGKPYEQLEAWKFAMQSAKAVYDLTVGFCVQKRYGLAQGHALRAVDSIKVRTCSEIGQHIVELEQLGADRAAYGVPFIPRLAKSLTGELGRGGDASNLRYMRIFYLAFPICDALRRKLSWTHYRNLLRVGGRGFFFESFRFRPGTAHDLKPATVIALAASHIRFSQ